MDAIQFHDMQVFMKGLFFGTALGSAIVICLCEYFRGEPLRHFAPPACRKFLK